MLKYFIIDAYTNVDDVLSSDFCFVTQHNGRNDVIIFFLTYLSVSYYFLNGMRVRVSFGAFPFHQQLSLKTEHYILTKRDVCTLK